MYMTALNAPDSMVKARFIWPHVRSAAPEIIVIRDSVRTVSQGLGIQAMNRPDVNEMEPYECPEKANH